MVDDVNEHVAVLSGEQPPTLHFPEAWRPMPEIPENPQEML